MLEMPLVHCRPFMKLGCVSSSTAVLPVVDLALALGEGSLLHVFVAASLHARLSGGTVTTILAAVVELRPRGCVHVPRLSADSASCKPA
jgi:hypothetical protein